MNPTELKCAQCGRTMDIVRYRCEQCDLAVEGRFELPPLSRLSAEDQAFVTAFVRVHGNIKKMEGLFGVSYPTIKKRLNEITARLDASVEVADEPLGVLTRLERGEISLDQALEMLGE